jgi:hypothetical protein
MACPGPWLGALSGGNRPTRETDYQKRERCEGAKALPDLDAMGSGKKSWGHVTVRVGHAQVPTLFRSLAHNKCRELAQVPSF